MLVFKNTDKRIKLFYCSTIFFLSLTSFLITLLHFILCYFEQFVSSGTQFHPTSYCLLTANCNGGGSSVLIKWSFDRSVHSPCVCSKAYFVFAFWYFAMLNFATNSYLKRYGMFYDFAKEDTKRGIVIKNCSQPLRIDLHNALI